MARRVKKPLTRKQRKRFVGDIHRKLKRPLPADLSSAYKINTLMTNMEEGDYISDALHVKYRKKEKNGKIQEHGNR